jgi:predicted Zn-dependent protease
VASRTGGVAIKVILKKKIGTMLINTLDESKIVDAVEKAVGIAKVSPPNKDFKSLPEPQKWTTVRAAFDTKTASCTPDFRAQKVRDIIDEAHSKSSRVKAVAGSYSTGSSSFAVSNSLGVSAWAEFSLAAVNVTVISEAAGSQGFGSGEQYSRFVKDLKHVQVAKEAADKSVRSIKPVKVQPGEYEVVLSPRAVSTLISFLGFMGFSATSYQDGQSFVKYHLGEQTFDRKLTVEDDSRDPLTLYSMPVDGEGLPKKPLVIIDEGVVSEKSICYDSFTAGREKGKRSTGHAPPPIIQLFGPMRPVPINLIVAGGDATPEEMIKDTKHGIFVTRFHYTNPVDPTRAILTGLTRDGTFLIEKGELSKPVMNLRYTDSMLSALGNIDSLGKKLQMVDATTAPAMKLQKLRFTGVTQY